MVRAPAQAGPSGARGARRAVLLRQVRGEHRAGDEVTDQAQAAHAVFAGAALPRAPPARNPLRRCAPPQAEGTDRYLLIEGRPEVEVLSTEAVRPIPPRNAAWAPEVGTCCEFLFAEGWGTVLVQKALGATKWQVVYEPHSAVHQATRENLRQIVTWDGARFHPTGK